MYFHVVYGGARRRYGGAGRNRLHSIVKYVTQKPKRKRYSPPEWP